MTNLPTSPAGTAMTPEQRRAAVREKAAARTAAGDLPTARSGSVFISFDGNTGAATYGRDGAEIPEGQKFVVPLDMIKHGIRYWDGGKPTKEHFVPMLEGAAPYAPEGEPKVGDLPKPRQRDGWSDVIEVTFVGIDGGDLDGIQLEQGCSSMGAHGAAVDLSNAMMARAREGLLFDAIIEYSSGSYFNKTYARDIHYPVFKIVEWTDGITREPAQVAQIEADDVLG